ncbi:hypothetical protein Mmc1_2001 [Magnetococcus marinus MC-1]|uniref:Uncharacterized protein n=1 Tax=Magnetococcus marinus (strain ATCC BAA-1437 / JCM 17883 / MC-1) TaxID=156889 RepID=A0L959_MAGMM|nr:hypothetical protein Mmc1_2001 [Magnetococcus marinus MC-1]
MINSKAVVVLISLGLSGSGVGLLATPQGGTGPVSKNPEMFLVGAAADPSPITGPLGCNTMPAKETLTPYTMKVNQQGTSLVQMHYMITVLSQFKGRI